MREPIFSPLGMTGTSFGVPAAQLDRLVSCYQTRALELHDGVNGSRWSRSRPWRPTS